MNNILKSYTPFIAVIPALMFNFPQEIARPGGLLGSATSESPLYHPSNDIAKFQYSHLESNVSIREIEKNTNGIYAVAVNSNALSELRELVKKWEPSHTVTRDELLKLIIAMQERERKNVDRNQIRKIFDENGKEIRDGKKASKMNETLRDEIDRLRKKK